MSKNCWTKHRRMHVDSDRGRPKPATWAQASSSMHPDHHLPIPRQYRQQVAPLVCPPDAQGPLTAGILQQHAVQLARLSSSSHRTSGRPPATTRIPTCTPPLSDGLAVSGPARAILAPSGSGYPATGPGTHGSFRPLIYTRKLASPVPVHAHLLSSVTIFFLTLLQTLWLLEAPGLYPPIL